MIGIQLIYDYSGHNSKVRNYIDHKKKYFVFRAWCDGKTKVDLPKELRFKSQL